jgi:hypothetical protein
MTDGPKYPMRDLTEGEKLRYAEQKFIKYEAYPADMSPVVGRYWSQEMLDNDKARSSQEGC